MYLILFDEQTEINIFCHPNELYYLVQQTSLSKVNLQMYYENTYKENLTEVRKCKSGAPLVRHP